jgi:hypothetical protein
VVDPFVVQPTLIHVVYQEEFVDVADIDNQDLGVPGTSSSLVDVLPNDILVDNDIENDEIEVIMENHEIDFDCISMGAGEDPVFVDWRGLFNSDRSLGNLQYFPPVKKDGKVFVSPPGDDVEKGIAKWKTSLVGQLRDKPLPFFLAKKSVAIMWKQYGEIEVFSLENGMYIFKFPDEVSCEEVLKAILWPVILRKWQPGMQVLKLTLSTIPVWIKLMHFPMEFWTSNCLSHMASGVGKPMYADKITEEQKRLGYACVLVEIDVRLECPKELFISRCNG